ncbi:MULTISPECIES: Sapep family Mn(2+)-dependent dipeptidase [Eubacteriales]|uniref:Sapep family Mn(2+)-dependent dipeptidase n=1 Tax=Bittarella massiliensis (ex Durand et al. 2017) TaxID=1720313 RepID=A0AAQ1ME19_9FIRM|nr:MULTISPECIES: Sapep family Mn(2+)-dependent dipeptidase [Eubacteriales]ERJ00288.1 putative dipeptidase [Clostridium sp. ATCC 29733]MZL70294.1 Sapep family Mn(2+)-dependent dipeptidase [Bittarella massiliensis (ex Durand et al. 2017)]MZL80940.1 Sapep family Mn(2+)-dependent dipeptidase [Bittarella massiliensis (ex Durand et al. 2017)]SHG17770.1 succinyl-diaminopimelate desuccinylase [Bittarella massiliensis (ex Durand et al. 2017)]
MKERIQRFIEENTPAMLEDLRRLVAIPSMAPVVPASGRYPYLEGCAKALDYMLARGKELGLSADNVDYHCGVLSYGSSAAGSIGIACHLDVVPPGSGWSHDPFDMVEKDGRVYGRGVNDNKGAAAMALYAMKFLQESGLPLKHRVDLILGCDEETGMTDMPYYLKHRTAPKMTLVPDGTFPVCIGEKGLCEGDIISRPIDNSPIVVFEAGVASNVVPDKAHVVIDRAGLPPVDDGELLVREENGQTILDAFGRSAHASTPEKGDNAIAKAVRYLLDNDVVDGYEREVLELCWDLSSTIYGEGFGVACEEEVFKKLTCICGTLNKKEERYLIGFNIRWPMAIDAEALKAGIELCCDDIGGELFLPLFDPPHYIDPDHPGVRTLCDCYDRVTGEQCEPYVVYGATYARYFPLGLTYGPSFVGDDASLPEGFGAPHQPDEVMPIATLQKALGLYIETLLELDSVL